MTLLSSPDTGPGTPRASAAILPETQARTPGSATPGTAQAFAMLLATGQAEGLAATAPVDATALPPVPAEAGTPDGDETALPDILAQLLTPATDAEAPAPQAPADLHPTLALSEMPVSADLPEAAAPLVAAEPGLPDARELPDLVLSSQTQGADLPDAAAEAAETLPSDPSEATDPAPAAEPAPDAPALAPGAELAPEMPAAAPGGLDLAAPMSPPRSAGARTDPALTAEPKAQGIGPSPSPRPEAARAEGPVEPEPLNRQTIPSEVKPVAGPDAATPPADPAMPGAEAPRPVAVSVTQAPAPQTVPAAAAGLPVLQMTRADWPVDLAERLLESASLRSLSSGGLMEIRLDPDTLGPVTLRLEVADGTANVAIVTQTPEAARLFTDNQHRLADALSRAGLDLGQHSAGTDARGGQQDRERPGPESAAGPADTQRPETPPRRVPQDRRVDLIA